MEKRGCQSSRNHGVGVHYGVANGGVMRPFASYQIPLTLWFVRAPSWGSWLLFFIKHEIGDRSDVDNRSNPRGDHCKTASVAVLSVTVNASETPVPDTINTGNQVDRGRRSFCRNPCDPKASPGALSIMSGEIIRELRKAQENKQVSVPATKDDMRKAA